MTAMEIFDKIRRVCMEHLNEINYIVVAPYMTKNMFTRVNKIFEKWVSDKDFDYDNDIISDHEYHKLNNIAIMIAESLQYAKKQVYGEAAAEIANSENTDNEQINRYWYTTESVNETLPDYVGLFESAVKRGQEYANKLQEIVYVNLVKDIVQVIVPDNNEDVSRETSGYDAANEGLVDTSLETEESLATDYKEYLNRLYVIKPKAERISFINSELQRLAGLEEHDALSIANLIVKKFGADCIYSVGYDKDVILIYLYNACATFAFHIRNVEEAIKILERGE